MKGSRRAEEEVLGSEGMMADEEGEEIAEMTADSDVVRREIQQRT